MVVNGRYFNPDILNSIWYVSPKEGGGGGVSLIFVLAYVSIKKVICIYEKQLFFKNLKDEDLLLITLFKLYNEDND